MDLELKNLGQTLAIDGFVIFGLFSIVSIFKPDWASGLRLFSDRDHKLHESAMILALIFATGILAEDVSKNSIPESVGESAALSYLEFTDEVSLLKNLFEVRHHSKDHLEIKPKPVYIDLMDVANTDQYFTNHSNRIKACITNNYDFNQIVGENKIKELQFAVKGIYYVAKNRVYRESNYFNELQDIKTRVDFSSSLGLICLIYAICYLLLGVISLFPSRWTSKLGQAREKRSLIAGLFVAYLIGILLTGISFRSETKNYNLRVFGYYTSIIADNKEGKTIDSSDSSTK